MYTDAELISMTQQYEKTHDGKYIAHLAFGEINKQVSSGRTWAKCANCGNPYPLDRPDCDGTVCSKDCFDQYLAYINSESW